MRRTVMLDPPDDLRDRLRVHRRRLLNHLVRARFRELVCAPDVDERVRGDLGDCARGHGAHRVVAVDDAEDVLASAGLGELVHVRCEGLQADARAPVGVHVAEDEVLELGRGLLAEELGVGQGAVRAPE